MNFRYRIRSGIGSRISGFFSVLGWAVSCLCAGCSGNRNPVDLPRPDWNPEVLVFDNGRFRLEWPETLSRTVITQNFNLRGGDRELALSTGPWGPGIPLSAGVTAGGFPGVGKVGVMESSLGLCPVSHLPFGQKFFGEKLTFDRTFVALPLGQDTRIDLSWTLDGQDAVEKDSDLLARVLSLARRVAAGEALRTPGAGEREIVFAGLGLILPADMTAWGGMEMLGFQGETNEQIILLADTAPLVRSLEEEAAERLYLPDLELVPPARRLSSIPLNLSLDSGVVPGREVLWELNYRQDGSGTEPDGSPEHGDGPTSTDAHRTRTDLEATEDPAAGHSGAATVLIWQIESLDPGKVFNLLVITRGDLLDRQWFEAFCGKIRFGIRIHDFTGGK